MCLSSEKVAVPNIIQKGGRGKFGEVKIDSVKTQGGAGKRPRRELGS